LTKAQEQKGENKRARTKTKRTGGSNGIKTDRNGDKDFNG
jgi:hypothetical protein